MNTLETQEYDVIKLAKMIRQDPSLSYRLLRYINSAGLGVVNKVESLPQAISLLGEKQLSQWLKVVIFSDLASTKASQEVAFLAVQRGRFLELLSGLYPSHRPESMFLLGLFSFLDVMLGLPMPKILQHMPLDPSLADTLCGKITPLLLFLDLAQAFEQHQTEQVTQLSQALHLTVERVTNMHTKAMRWTVQLFSSLQKKEKKA